MSLPSQTSRAPLVDLGGGSVALPEGTAGGPWIFPGGDASAPALRVGQALLVAVNNDGATLWSLAPGGASQVTLGAGALAAWKTARWALTRSVPHLWRALPPLSPPNPVLLAMAPRESRTTPAQIVRLDQASFGVAFLLSLASTARGECLLEDVAALGCVDHEGAVLPVEDLGDKLRALAWMAPRIQRVLVPQLQKEEAGAAAAALRRALAIVPVSTARAAVQAAFAREGSAPLVSAAASPSERAAIAEDFMRLVYDGRTALADWGPVEDAADLALETWGRRLSPRHRWILQYACGVAARHRDNAAAAGQVPAVRPSTRGMSRRARAKPGPRRVLPRATRERLQSFPAPVRLSIVANYIQQAADTGRPTAAQTAVLARPFLVAPADAFPEHAKIRGALGRLLANSGDPARALRLQREAVEMFFLLREPEETSRPIAECYRLAGALARPRDFAWAATALTEAERLGAFDDLARQYVDLARAKGLAGLGRGREALALLRELLDRPLMASVRGSAIRWLRRVSDSVGEPCLLEPAIEKYTVLIALDEAVARGDQRTARACVDRLSAIEPGLIGHVLAAARRLRRDPAAYVATFYPY